jgi:hypothetical protein
MRKPENTTKFPEKIQRQSQAVQTFDTAEEAVEEAQRQAAAANVPPSAIMVTYKDGYVTGDGEVHGAQGITAPPRTAPKEAEATLQVPATESYAPEPEVEVEVKAVEPEALETPEVEAEAPIVEVETPEDEFSLETPEVEVETKEDPQDDDEAEDELDEDEGEALED